jgi:LysM repeat protein
MRHPSLARVLAPLALVASAAAVVLVIASSDAVSGNGGTTTTRTTTSARPHTTPAASTQRTTTTPAGNIPAFYVVKSGDILTTIAERTGVSVARILELNPDIDPQALVAGQQIKLRP